MFKKIHRELKKESCRKIGNGLLVMALICCLMFVSYQATSAVITSATVGDRELPIYCVDTTEKKVALSFDAAWGAEDFPRIMDVLDNYATYKTCYDIEKADVEADEEVPSSQASKAIRKFAIEHPHNIQEKSKVIINTFESNIFANIEEEKVVC